MYYGFIYFTHNNPPEISNVKVFQDGDKIKIDYKRKDEDGPFLNNIAINKDRIDWFIDNKIVSGFKNKREIPVPDEKDKKIFVSCVVTGYDGINKSKKVKSNSLEYFIESISTTPVQIAAAEETEESPRLGPKVIYIPIDEKHPKSMRLIPRGGSGLKQHVPIPIYDFQTKQIIGYRDSTTNKETYVPGYDPNAKPTVSKPQNEKPQNEKPRHEKTLNLYVKDILNDSPIPNATVTYNNDSTATDRWGFVEFKVNLSNRNSFKLSIDESNHYSKIINTFVLNDNEKYIAYLIPKSFDLEYYDQVARSTFGYTSHLNNPTLIINSNHSCPK